MRIILISGSARNGKDQTAEFIKEYIKHNNKRVLIIHYADFLKDFCAKHYGYRGVKDSADRQILQYVGTDIVRRNNQDAWVNMMVELLKGVRTEYDFVLIPDVRFPNEIEIIKENFENVFCLNVVRHNFDNGLAPSQQSHPSETALLGYKFDENIFNDGTLEDLSNTVKNIINNKYRLEK